MAGDMNTDCLEALWVASKYIAQMQEILVQEGHLQDAESPENWLSLPVAIPEDLWGKVRFDIYPQLLTQVMEDIAQNCQDRFPEHPSAEQLTVFGIAGDLKHPMTGGGPFGPWKPPETDAYKLWNQLNEYEYVILRWVDSIFLEPSRYATANSR